MIKNHLFNDLVWAVSSPPLIVMPSETCLWYSSEFYRDLYHSSADWFSELERYPEKLQALVEKQKDKRMGKLFETLWAAYLNDSERFEIVEHGLQIIDGGKTLGEIDFIVVDKKTHKMLHWELAVKFYLGIGDTRVWENWYGPAKKDRLDLKMNHLVDHQTKLSLHEATKKVLREKKIKIDNSGVILKGCLFYPSNNGSSDNSASGNQVNDAPKFASSDHCKSRWLRLSDCGTSLKHDDVYYPLVGEGWMASLDSTQLEMTYTQSEIINVMTNGKYRLPLLISVIKQGLEVEKIFIVQDDWQQK